ASSPAASMPAAASRAGTSRRSAANISRMPLTQVAAVVRLLMRRASQRVLALAASTLAPSANDMLHCNIYCPGHTVTGPATQENKVLGKKAREKETPPDRPDGGGRREKAMSNRRLNIDLDPQVAVLPMLEEAMRRYADKPAFRCFGRTLSYADTDRLSRAFAAFLQHRLGVTKGQRVAVMLPNIPAFPLALLGIVRAGAAQVNVNPLYTPRELEHQLNDAGAEIVVIFTGVSATLAEIIAKTKVKHVIAVGLGDGIGGGLPSPAIDARLANTIGFGDALAEGAKLDFVP